mmetsp:Transcript_35023/g.84757  ORF Transcript_35023/g.84757 Transcript_35023/m.84757 type:complete len:93 (-) Transcript_35023:769-1047(-)
MIYTNSIRLIQIKLIISIQLLLTTTITENSHSSLHALDLDEPSFTFQGRFPLGIPRNAFATNLLDLLLHSVPVVSSIHRLSILTCHQLSNLW